jgi:hypothetical protein
MQRALHGVGDRGQAGSRGDDRLRNDEPQRAGGTTGSVLLCAKADDDQAPGLLDFAANLARNPAMSSWSLTSSRRAPVRKHRANAARRS